MAEIRHDVIPAFSIREAAMGCAFATQRFLHDFARFVTLWLRQTRPYFSVIGFQLDLEVTG